MARKKTKTILITTVIAVVVILSVSFLITKDGSAPGLNNSEQTNRNENNAEPTNDQPAAFDKSLHSTSEPASLWVVVNKKRPLPSSYVPANLSNASGVSMKQDAATATKQLIAGATNGGVSLKAISGYRSYASQQSVYNSYVQSDGQADADTYSARPGHSEHQTGLAADLGNSSGTCDLEICFENTAGGKWLKAHAHEYGFVIRYPKGKTSVTGYQYEPWHIRYVGKELAAELNKSGQTMEEFFGLPAAPGY